MPDLSCVQRAPRAGDDVVARDAARLVWGPVYSDKLYNSIYRSPYLDEKTYVENTEIKTQPPLQSNLLKLPDNR